MRINFHDSLISAHTIYPTRIYTKIYPSIVLLIFRFLSFQSQDFIERTHLQVHSSFLHVCLVNTFLPKPKHYYYKILSHSFLSFQLTTGCLHSVCQFATLQPASFSTCRSSCPTHPNLHSLLEKSLHNDGSAEQVEADLSFSRISEHEIRCLCALITIEF